MHILMLLAVVPFAIIGGIICLAVAASAMEVTFKAVSYGLRGLLGLHPIQQRCAAIRAERVAARRALWRAKPWRDRLYVILSFGMLGAAVAPAISLEALNEFGLCWSDWLLYVLAVASIVAMTAWVGMTVVRVLKVASRVLRTVSRKQASAQDAHGRFAPG